MANGHGGRRANAGRKRFGPPLWNHTLTVPEPFKDFLDQWEGDTPSQKFMNAMIDLERFMPMGPTFEKRRGDGGRFAKHTPSLAGLYGPKAGRDG